MKITHKIQETFQSLKSNFTQGIFTYDSSLAKSQEPRAKSQEPRAKSQEPRAKSQDGDYVIHSPNPLWQSFRKGLMMGFGIMLGMFGTGVMAVAVTGTIKTWTANEKLTASDLNTTIASLKTAIESIPNWTKNGTSVYYNDGNVGIGTSSPTEKLQVNGNLLVNGNITSLNTGQKIVAYPTLSAGNPDYTWSGQTTTGMFLPASGQIGFSTGGSEKVRIDGNGNVGIGIINPTSKLHIETPGSSSPIKLMDIYTSSFGNVTNSENSYYLKIGESSGTIMIVKGSGKVGIGTASPSYTLHVNGSVAGTSAYNNLSDGRYKENIQPIPNALDKIEKLRGVTYTWKQKENKELNLKEGRDLGFIGQEVEKILPEAVSEDDKGILSLAYSNIIPVIVEAIKELKRNQNERNEDLYLRLRSVSEENTELKTRYTTLLDDHTKLKSENKKIQEQLNELRKENSEFKMSVLEELKQIKEMRYAKKSFLFQF